MCFVSFLCVSEVEVVLPFCSFLYLSMAGMLYTIIPPIHFNGDALCELVSRRPYQQVLIRA